MTKLYEEFIRCKAEEIDKINFSDKGELTIVISEKKLNTKVFNYLNESDKKLINKMLPKKSIKDINTTNSTISTNNSKSFYDLILLCGGRNSVLARKLMGNREIKNDKNAITTQIILLKSLFFCLKKI